MLDDKRLRLGIDVPNRVGFDRPDGKPGVHFPTFRGHLLKVLLT